MNKLSVTLCFTCCSCCKRAVLQRSACPHSVSACADKPLARADVMSPLLRSSTSAALRLFKRGEPWKQRSRYASAGFWSRKKIVRVSRLSNLTSCRVVQAVWCFREPKRLILSVHHVRCSFLWPSRVVAVELEIPLSGLLDSCLRLRDARARRRQLKWHAQQQHTPQQQHYSSPPRPASGQRRRDGPPPRCTPSR